MRLSQSIALRLPLSETFRLAFLELPLSVNVQRYAHGILSFKSGKGQHDCRYSDQSYVSD